MIDLKVSKGIYLISTNFSCIINYLWFRDQYKILIKKNIFTSKFSKTIKQRIYIFLHLIKKFGFLKKKITLMKNNSLLKDCKCIHCKQKIDQINNSRLYWDKLILSKKLT